MKDLLETFRTQLGSQSVLHGADISHRYHCDSSGINPYRPLAVLIPRSVEDLVFIMTECHEKRQPVVVQGGMTGLCSGATPQTGELAISLEKLCGIEEIDPDAMTMTVYAGTPLQLIQESAEAAGFVFPLDLGARGSCTIGGNIATNAGGTEVIRFGMARSLVLGLEAVLPDGTVLTGLNKMLKNNAGFDLKHLFIGTEGILGIITRAVLRLYPAPATRCTAFCAVSNLQDCILLLRELRQKLGHGLSSFEVMWPDYIQYTLRHFDEISFPFEDQSGIYVLTEFSGFEPDTDSTLFENVLGTLMDTGLIVDAVIAQSKREVANIWRIREAIGEIFQKLDNVISFDISAPIGTIPAMLDSITHDLHDRYDSITILTYGHLGDSNIHLTITTGLKDDLNEISDIVYRRVGEPRGSVSGEHGIGVTKRKYLSICRNENEIRLMRSLKSLLDPRRILNPNRVIP